jgi:hypothetical protein
MTSRRQLRANRLNALRSTGPRSLQGKLRSRTNAIRHGLTAETVISVLEDAAEYEAFQAAILSDYPDRSAVENELVLRLVSVLWRLRRATAVETGLLHIQTSLSQAHSTHSRLHATIDIPKLYHALALTRSRSVDASAHQTAANDPAPVHADDEHLKRGDAALAKCFLNIANLPNNPLDRISRYEASLWRQAQQLIYLLWLDRSRSES